MKDFILKQEDIQKQHFYNKYYETTKQRKNNSLIIKHETPPWPGVAKPPPPLPPNGDPLKRPLVELLAINLARQRPEERP